jgi:hypothetical protein
LVSGGSKAGAARQNDLVPYVDDANGTREMVLAYSSAGVTNAVASPATPAKKSVAWIGRHDFRKKAGLIIRLFASA